MESQLTVFFSYARVRAQAASDLKKKRACLVNVHVSIPRSRVERNSNLEFWFLSAVFLVYAS